MKKKTKPYITLRDRTWKGKEWWTSFSGNKFIRRLTDEEAARLGDVEEVVVPEYQENVVGSKDGRLFCKKCGGRSGFYTKKRPFGRKINIYTCADCGAKEKETF